MPIFGTIQFIIIFSILTTIKHTIPQILITVTYKNIFLILVIQKWIIPSIYIVLIFKNVKISINYPSYCIQFGFDPE